MRDRYPKLTIRQKRNTHIVNQSKLPRTPDVQNFA